MHEEVENSRLYTDAQRQNVLHNLHAMAKNVARLRNGSTASTASNLREALKIRLSILNDNVQGCGGLRADHATRTHARARVVAHKWPCRTCAHRAPMRIGPRPRVGLPPAA